LDDKSEQTKKLNEQFLQTLSADLASTYMKAARASAKVSINDDLWRQIAGADAAQ
jgi:hypothetical protein